ncbi:putative ATP adenylyltransferase [Blattamonas nauphoetae]|uniref:ATP adenylyltransferase n=1 Tax=Blattamonas nauphoetae TaxID=2049346 RepID=A0ABQ9XFP8_9EUKA|nr:putative ATP adenylyltransferase [Blattamonas nauphoetae]
MTLLQKIIEKEKELIASNHVLPTLSTTRNLEEPPYLMNLRMPSENPLQRDRNLYAGSTIHHEPQNASTQKSSPTLSDPFECPDPGQIIETLFNTHHILINKYLCADHHIVVPTVQFEDQLSHLTLADCCAASKILSEIDGVLWYNSGRNSGASQIHKHLQCIPLDSFDSVPIHQYYLISPTYEPKFIDNPINPLFKSLTFFSPCLHAFHEFSVTDVERSAHDPNQLLSLINSALLLLETEMKECGYLPPDSPPVLEQSPAPFSYNVVITRKVLLVVPRQRSEWIPPSNERSRVSPSPIGANSLGMAGFLYAKTPEIQDALLTFGARNFIHALCFVHPER